VGATFGAIGGAIGPPISSAITQATGSAFVGAVGSAAITGAGFGAASAGMAGGDVGQGALWGAATGAVLSAVLYAGYNAAQSDLSVEVSAPSDACDGCEDPVRVRPFARRIPGTLASHKGIEASFPEGIARYEMGPDISGNIAISQSFDGDEGLIRGTQAAFRTGRVVYGQWSVVSRAALTTQQSLYEAQWVGQPYYPTYRNSNYYVDSVLRGAGANPRVPGVFAPAF
jgi:hypothetical protein